MPFSDPLLPVAFVRQVESHDVMRGFRSSVYERTAHEQRLAMRRWIKPASPDVPIVLPQPSSGFTREARRGTYLHYYAVEGDVLALSELIGWGATIDIADSQSQTPLCLVFLEMARVKSPEYIIINQAHRARLGTAEKEKLFSQLAWAARILIEQHANINVVIGGDSLINLSCSWKDWDTIALLLEHGATTSRSTLSRFSSRTDRKRFSDLLKSHGSGRPRPPRICPCWSGKIVSDCHGRNSQPYPLEYICVCGSGKTYERCCHKRGKLVVEKWDDQTQRILHDIERPQTVLRERVENTTALGPILREVDIMMGTERSIPETLEIQRKMAADLLSNQLIDPAFAYAMNHAKFPYPRYVHGLLYAFTDFLLVSHTRFHGRSSSQYYRKDIQAEWNKLVDDYIDQSGDTRPREEIEKAAKIGSTNGAFLRTCGGVGCGNDETKDVKFDCCSKCKLVSTFNWH